MKKERKRDFPLKRKLLSPSNRDYICLTLSNCTTFLLIASLTQGGYAGDAAGFKMMSLLKLPEIRANKPGVSLIHFIAQQSEKSAGGSLSHFSQELPSLEEASK